MKVKTTSVAYDDKGKILASYDSEDVFEPDELDDVLEELRIHYKPTKEDVLRQLAEEADQDDEESDPCEDCDAECPLLAEDNECDEDDDFDGDEILHLEVSLDALKIVCAVAGGLIGLKVLHELAKAVF